MTRRETREQLIKLLFLREFHDSGELAEQNSLYFDVFTEYPAEVSAEILDRYNLIVDKLGEIDAILADATSGWKLNRLGKVELSILRLAVYEIRFDESVPGKTAINEAVELAKLYGGDQSYVFINGVLAKVI